RTRTRRTLAHWTSSRITSPATVPSVIATSLRPLATIAPRTECPPRSSVTPSAPTSSAVPRQLPTSELSTVSARIVVPQPILRAGAEGTHQSAAASTANEIAILRLAKSVSLPEWLRSRGSNDYARGSRPALLEFAPRDRLPEAARPQ